MHLLVDAAGERAPDLRSQGLQTQQEAGRGVGEAPAQAGSKSSARLAQKPGPYYRVREAPPQEAAQAVLEVMRAEREASRAAQGAAQRSRRLQRLADVVALHAAEDLHAVVTELPERILPGSSHALPDEAAARKWDSANIPRNIEAQGAPAQAVRSEARSLGQAMLPDLEAARFPLEDLQQRQDVAFLQPRQLLPDPFGGNGGSTVIGGGQDQGHEERYPSWGRQAGGCTVSEGRQDPDHEESYPSWARQAGAARSARHKRSAAITGGFHQITGQSTPGGEAGPADGPLFRQVPRKRRSSRQQAPNTKPVAMDCTASPDLSAVLATPAIMPKQKDQQAHARAKGLSARAKDPSSKCTAMMLAGHISRCWSAFFCDTSWPVPGRNAALSNINRL